MKVALTGSAGFIGDATKRLLEGEGHEVVPIDRSTGNDVRDPNLHKAVKGCDSIIHLAGVLGTSELFDTIDQAVDVNIGGTLNVLKAADKRDLRYVGITMPDCWPSIYQATKLAGVRLSHAFNHARGLPVTHIRAFNAYGPKQAHGKGHPQKIVPTFATCSWRGDPMPIFGDGQQTTDIVHVDHIAWLLAQCAVGMFRRPASLGREGLGNSTRYFGDDLVPGGNGETFDAGTGQELTVNEVARRVADVTGNHTIQYLPMRTGELPDTRLCATDPGLFPYDRFDYDLFREAVESYKP